MSHSKGLLNRCPGTFRKFRKPATASANWKCSRAVTSNTKLSGRASSASIGWAVPVRTLSSNAVDAEH